MQRCCPLRHRPSSELNAALLSTPSPPELELNAALLSTPSPPELRAECSAVSTPSPPAAPHPFHPPFLAAPPSPTSTAAAATEPQHSCSQAGACSAPLCSLPYNSALPPARLSARSLALHQQGRHWPLADHAWGAHGSPPPLGEGELLGGTGRGGGGECGLGALCMYVETALGARGTPSVPARYAALLPRGSAVAGSAARNGSGMAHEPIL